MDASTVGKTLKQARERKGLTKKEMSNLIGCSPSTIKNYEDGKGIKDFSKLISMIETYDLDVKEVLGIDSKTNLVNGETILNRQARLMMGKNISTFNGKFNSTKKSSDSGFVNGNENNALIFYNNLISNIDVSILNAIFSYMVYPSKDNPFIDNSCFINDMQCSPDCPNPFYDEDEEQSYEFKAVLAFQRLMKKIRKSEDIVKWIEYFDKKQQENIDAQIENSIWWHEYQESLTPEKRQKEDDAMNFSAELDYEESKQITEANKIKMTNYRNRVKKVHEKNTSKKKDVLNK